jgi:hypothetical protein
MTLYHTKMSHPWYLTRAKVIVFINIFIFSQLILIKADALTGRTAYEVSGVAYSADSQELVGRFYVFVQGDKWPVRVRPIVEARDPIWPPVYESAAVSTNEHFSSRYWAERKRALVTIFPGDAPVSRVSDYNIHTDKNLLLGLEYANCRPAVKLF